MSYSVDELNPLLEEIFGRISEKITLANREETLLETLKELGMEDLVTLLPQKLEFEHLKTGKILVAGDYKGVGADKLKGIAKTQNISSDRLEFLDYHEVKMEGFRRYQYQSKYAAIMLGPTGHSGRAKGNYSSVQVSLKSEEGYPPVIEMRANSQSGELKITKSNFRMALAELIEKNVIQVA